MAKRALTRIEWAIMSLIVTAGLCKHFKVLRRHEGLFGAVRDLFSRDYQTIKAVDGISMSIGKGEIVGFAGPNGAGKSTTIKMLTGVLKPTGGHCTVHGYIPFAQRRTYVQHIGVVFGQRTQLWWDLPVIESFKLLKEIYRIERRAFEENIALFDELVELRRFYATPVRHLSLGQRMLCDIAAAFLHNPAVLFLDEPTIGLDIINKGKILSIIRRLNGAKKTTVLLTTHDIGDMENLCERIILIDKGTIVCDKPKAEFNTLFGSYRTLEVELDKAGGERVEALRLSLKAAFPGNSFLKIEPKEGNWIDITVNQDAVPLLDVLAAVMRRGGVRDVRIREVELEHIIAKVYKGGLYAPVF